ncbi:helix-turn-helix domain-containing protein [Microbulbifer sp. OS29]|uniref:Helix-turn-helix domain-containing protein n=1 Tax=Microbulbifer okhotskensis TaxID=2926617 RepID=A0A9X2J7L7_9GAMM|nr:helix-turn-helix transcriptional regulator [Microbulbifer okhotskensis]MCO1336734.1 helix-turn-helix domain-containing protein [Microbulbifer okhotskensis]
MSEAETLGNRLRNARKMDGKTISQLATQLGLTLSNFENGNRQSEDTGGAAAGLVRGGGDYVGGGVRSGEPAPLCADPVSAVDRTALCTATAGVSPAYPQSSRKRLPALEEPAVNLTPQTAEKPRRSCPAHEVGDAALLWYAQHGRGLMG